MRDQPTSNREAELTAPPRIGSGDWLGRVLVACEYSGSVRDAFDNLSPIPRRLPLSQPSAFFVPNQNRLTPAHAGVITQNAVAPQGAAAGGR